MLGQPITGSNNKQAISSSAGIVQKAVEHGANCTCCNSSPILTMFETSNLLPLLLLSALLLPTAVQGCSCLPGAFDVSRVDTIKNAFSIR